MYAQVFLLYSEQPVLPHKTTGVRTSSASMHRREGYLMALDTILLYTVADRSRDRSPSRRCFIALWAGACVAGRRTSNT